MVDLTPIPNRSFQWGPKVTANFEALNAAKTEAADVQVIADAAAEAKFVEVVANPNDSAVAALVETPASATATALNSTYRAIEAEIGESRAAAEVATGRVPSALLSPAPTVVNKRAFGLASIASLVSGGSGYVVDEVITLAGGTFDTAAQVRVATVSGGAVTSLTVYRGGIYTVSPSGTFTQGSTSGAGTGLQMTGSWGGTPSGLNAASGASFNATGGVLRFTGNGPSNISSTGAYGNTSGVGTSSTWEWTGDGAYLEIRILANNTEATLFVDDRRVMATPVVTDSSGGWWIIHLTFATAASRRFRLFMGRNGALHSVRASNTGGATVTAPTVSRPLAWGLGDSYMEGSGAAEIGLTSFMTMCEQLGVDGLPDGVGGAGWDGSTAGTALERVNAKLATLTRTPDIIVWDLGYNDSADTPATIAAAIETVVLRAAELFPTAQQIAFSPATPVGETPALVALRDAMAAKFDALGVHMVDQTNWVTARTKGLYTGADNVHPTPTGHAYLGARKAASARPYLTLP